jgi:site-specific recombinase XerD
VVVNQWLRELPTSGAPSPNTSEAYARALRDWLVFLGERGVGAFERRDRLRSGLSLYAEYRLSGPLLMRLAETSWDLHTTVLARFYDWAVDEGHAPATPFAYGSAKRLAGRRRSARGVQRGPVRHRTDAQNPEITRLRAALTRNWNVRVLAPLPDQL